jgi:hypothetical protein
MRPPRAVPLAITFALAAAAAAAATPATAASCRHRPHHRCPVFEPHEGLFSSPGSTGDQPVPYLSFQAGQRPPSVALGRVRLLVTCEPSGAQVELEGGLSARSFKLNGPSFSVTSNVVNGAIELFEEATAGTVRFAGRFNSPTAATVNVQVTGLALPKIYPQSPTGEASVLTNQICSAGPLTYHVTRQRSRPVRP